MKKIKFFALAAFAMLSINAFAAVSATQEYTYEGLIYTLVQDDNGTAADPSDDFIYAEVKKVSDDAAYKALAAWVIPEKFKALADNGAVAPFAGNFVNVTGISANAFANNSNITSITFAKAENITSIAAGAFSKTSIASLDLSGTQITDVNQWFETTNKVVTTVKLPKSVTTIGANAFEGLSVLNSVTFAEQTAPAAYGLTINANAFKNTMKLKKLTLPANVSLIMPSAFEKTYLEELTIQGDVPAYVANTAGVQGLAFVRNGDQTLTVKYEPTANAGAGDPTSFAQNAFSANLPAATGADVWVTFKTSTKYGNAITGYATYVADAKGNKFYGAELDFTPTALETIPVYNNGGSYAYAGYTVTTANGIKIAKKQGENKDINVMVYGAYFDNIGGKGKNSAVMMDQLHLIEGYYWLPTGTNIIVKSSSEDPVEFAPVTAAEIGANDSRNLSALAGNPDHNEIKVFNAASGLADGEYAINVIDWYNTVVPGTTLYFLRDLKGGKEFGWKQRENDSLINYGQLFLPFVGTAAARIELIWSDGSEETTAIQTVKTATEDGAIYNLAGQKVNASYKGVVIKNGKKFIQK